MSAAVLANALWPVAAMALLRAAYAGARGHARERDLLVIAGLALFAAVCALEGFWAGVAWNAVVVALLLGGDWWNRNGRKVAKLIGQKSRAVLAAVVAKAREAGSSPVPQGVRA